MRITATVCVLALLLAGCNMPAMPYRGIQGDELRAAPLETVALGSAVHGEHQARFRDELRTRDALTSDEWAGLADGRVRIGYSRTAALAILGRPQHGVVASNAGVHVETLEYSRAGGGFTVVLTNGRVSSLLSY